MSVKFNNFIKSPLNYTGGKFRILNQTLALMPNQKQLLPMTNVVKLFSSMNTLLRHPKIESLVISLI